MLDTVLRDERWLPFVLPLLAMLVLLGCAFTMQAKADVDAPNEPGQCAIYKAVRDKHSTTYQLTCSDPQPDAIVIEHLDSDTARVFPRMAVRH